MASESDPGREYLRAVQEALEQRREHRERMREATERDQRAEEERESIAREELAKIHDLHKQIDCMEKELHEAHLLLSHNNVLNASDQKKT